MDSLPTPKRSRFFVLTLLLIIICAVVAAVYVATRKFEHDRTSAMTSPSHTFQTREESSRPQTVTRTYTQKEIEDARKNGKKLPGLAPTNLPGGQADAAVQQSMRTLDEINRINEMNRRLIEQQQRQQQQR